MKNYTITVNGNTYDVTVEEGAGGEAAPAAAAPAAAPKAAPAKKAAPAAAPAAAPKAAGAAGAVQVKASVPGKVLSVEANVGDAVSKGQNIIILEAMKMEVPVVAPQDGTVASIDVAVGASVENGDLLASLN